MKTKLTFLSVAILFAAWITMTAASDTKELEPPAANAKIETAVFAGGCFWCVEANFEKVKGVTEVLSGYTGGHIENPTYEQVCSHTTGHLESVQVKYDANLVTYNDLLEVFWRTVDPTDDGGQFVDRGEPYESAIFVLNENQRQQAEASKERLANSGRFDSPIVTPIREAAKFYVAEDYHQDYFRTHPINYQTYRFGSGRDQFIAKVWGDDAHYTVKGMMASDHSAQAIQWTDQQVSGYTKPAEGELRTRLTDLQFRVTQHEDTEAPFNNEYWNEKRDGIYVDIVSGEPLFSSKDKFDSGTGWASFSRPLVPGNIEEKVDRKLLSTRTEVRSTHADSHLGHIFDDGPQPTGLRYCINSAALKFIPAEKLEGSGYGFFQPQFASGVEI